MHIKQNAYRLITTAITIVFLTAVVPTHGLRDVRVRVPHAVRRGEKAILRCSYDIEEDSLYSVKWYKGRREFYRYTPKENPPMQVFQFQGIRIKRNASNESQVVLDSVTMASAGKYSCEVSADAPSFHTLIAAAEMVVVETPHNLPVITAIRQRYRIGDILRGNCTSRHSRPAANLTWTVNNEEVNPVLVRHHKIFRDPRNDMETTVVGIHFVINDQHFENGKMKLRCTASIYDIYHKSVEKTITEMDLYNRYASRVNMIEPEHEHNEPHPLHDSELQQKKSSYLTIMQDFLLQFGQKNKHDADDDEVVWLTSGGAGTRGTIIWQLLVIVGCVGSFGVVKTLWSCWQLAKLLAIGMLRSLQSKLTLVISKRNSSNRLSTYLRSKNCRGWLTTSSESQSKALSCKNFCSAGATKERQSI